MNTLKDSLNFSTRKRCLLIAPLSFYSYSEYLKKELSGMGYEVVLSNDEYPANSIGKIMGKLKIPILLYTTKQKLYKDYILGKNYDIVIIIKGRGMSHPLIKELKKICPKVIGYTFDSFKYHPAPKNWYKKLDAFFTFDYKDGISNKVDIIELFSSLPESEGEKQVQYEISAIARNHSKRLHFIDGVLSQFPIENNFIYIYEQNIITFLQNIISSPVLYIKYWKYIYFKPLSYNRYIEILNISNFVIDFAHPDQSGITIRCFEAQSARTKVITNNPNVFKNTHFNDLNTILVEHKKDFSSLKEKFQNIKKNTPVKYNRNITAFVNDILEKSNFEICEPNH
ncbi:MAG: hypothetical protein ABIN48_09930 [Ginsengibacter sp.]